VEADKILPNREFRNHLKHYDERIEEWLIAVPIDLSMNHSLRGFGGNDNLGYNLFGNSMVLCGERLHLNKVFNTLSEVYKTVSYSYCMYLEPPLKCIGDIAGDSRVINDILPNQL